LLSGGAFCRQGLMDAANIGNDNHFFVHEEPSKNLTPRQGRQNLGLEEKNL
jgi:hypothetical protein